MRAAPTILICFMKVTIVIYEEYIVYEEELQPIHPRIYDFSTIIF